MRGILQRTRLYNRYSGRKGRERRFGGYEGPLDVVSSGLVAAYGHWALSAAMLGSAYATIRRDSDDTEQAFNFDAVTGAAPTSDIATFIGTTFTKTGTFDAASSTQNIVLNNLAGVALWQVVSGPGISVGSRIRNIDVGTSTITIDGNLVGSQTDVQITFTRQGRFTSLRDQSGNNNHVIQNTAANQPVWAASVFGDVPAVRFLDESNAQLFLATPGNVTFGTGQYYFLVVVNVVSNGFRSLVASNFAAFAPGGDFSIQTAGNALHYFAEDDGFASGAGGDFNPTTTNPVQQNVLIEYAFSHGTPRIATINGASQTLSDEDDYGAGPVGAIVNRLAMGVDDAESPDEYLDGSIALALCYDTIPSSGDRALLRANIAAKCGITL